jgi:hypothetical protein
MESTSPRHGPDEFARRGGEIFDRDFRPNLQPEDDGKILAIDIESGRYELDRDDFAATERLLRRCPGAQIWLERVGRPAAYRIGTHTLQGCAAVTAI